MRGLNDELFRKECKIVRNTHYHRRAVSMYPAEYLPGRHVSFFLQAFGQVVRRPPPIGEILSAIIILVWQDTGRKSERETWCE